MIRATIAAASLILASGCTVVPAATAIQACYARRFNNDSEVCE